MDESVDAGTVDPGDEDATIHEPQGSGIQLQFASANEVPGTYSQGEGVTVELDAITLEIADLRLIGDAVAGEGPARTDRFELTLGPEGKTAAFPDVPPGIYSTVRGTIRDFEFDGDVELSGDEFALDFESESGAAVDFRLNLDNAVLGAGQVMSVSIELDAAAPLSSVDWDKAEPDDGEVELEGADLDAFLETLGDSLTVVDISTSDAPD